MRKHALGLTTGLLLLGIYGCAAQEDLSRDGQWEELEHEIERAPIFDSALHWEVVYDEMIEIGLEPWEARENVRRAARYGPALSEIVKILDEQRDPDALQEAISQTHSGAVDVARQIDEEVRFSYSHSDRVGADSAERVWRLLAFELEHSPIHTSAIHWKPIYLDMCRAGIAPRKARRNVRRAARFGPSRTDVAKILDDHASDPEGMQASLDVRHSELMDAIWKEEARGYGHFVGKPRKPPTTEQTQANVISGSVDEPAQPAGEAEWLEGDAGLEAAEESTEEPAGAVEEWEGEEAGALPDDLAEELGLEPEVGTEGLDLGEGMAEPAYEGLDEPPAYEGLDEPPVDEGLEEPPLDEGLDEPPLDEGLDQPPADEGLDEPPADESLPPVGEDEGLPPVGEDEPAEEPSNDEFPEDVEDGFGGEEDLPEDTGEDDLPEDAPMDEEPPFDDEPADEDG